MWKMSRTLFIAALLLTNVSGCAVLELKDTLPRAILNQQDPAIVRDGAPAFLIIVDALVEAAPYDTDYLLLASKLYSAYAGAFASTDEIRAKRLAGRAYEYGYRALCIELKSLCRAVDNPYDEYVAALSEHARPGKISVVYGFATAWATWLRANADDWQAIAQLSKIGATIKLVVDMDASYDNGTAQLYMGVLESQLPPALGGKPDVARQYFEQAILISNGRNLFAKVLFAENYARLVYDRELHDQLLNQVLTADPVENNLTLTNTLAQEKASVLLAESEAYFE